MKIPPFTIFILLITILATSVMGVDTPWSDTLTLPDSHLLSDPQYLGNYEAFEVRWVKFSLVDGDSGGSLYFQDSQTYVYHYDFAVQHIPQFAGFSANAFDQATLFNSGRSALLGAVLLISAQFGEPLAYGVQIVGQDPIPRELVATTIGKVQAAISGADALPAYYIPTFEQAGLAQDNLAWFASQGIEVASIQRWTGANATYSDGWALGRLIRVEPEAIDAAYQSGQLLPTDILLTSTVPAEVPFVAGIIATQPSTPNSHVATLAQSWDVPFVYTSMDTQALDSLVGKYTILDAGNNGGVTIQELDPDMPADMREEIISLKQTPELFIQPMETAGVLYLPVDGLRPVDLPLVGGKAAHFGLLRTAIPGNSPEAIAFTFDLWNAFLDQHLPARGRSLRQEITARLEPFRNYPPNMGSLADALDSIRDIIEDEAVFTEDLQSSILAALSSFDSGKNIRFRSSTNIEDTDTYTGAGLYDSVSGCLQDDLDGDETGPSHCDPDKSSERGVFRAIKKVYASFYGDNAYLERLRHGIDEASVGMALLVHHAFPDADELANGVAVLNHSRVEFTTQLGAVSVTNPEGQAIPELVVSYRSSSSRYSVYVQQPSSLLRLGEEAVMDLPDDYQTLHGHMFQVQELYAELYPERADVSLEFEFKKMAPNGQLVIKQVRPLPTASNQTYPRYFIAGSLDLEPFEGEQSDVFAIHRGQARFRVDLKSARIDNTDTISSPIVSLEYAHPVNGLITTWNTPPTTWPGAAFSVYEENWPRTVLAQSWSETIAFRQARRAFEILLPERGHSPFLFAESMDYRLRTEYPEKPHPWDTWPNWDPNQEPIEYVHLGPPTHANQPRDVDLPQAREFSTMGMQAEIAFYWPPDPNAAAGYTAPLRAWESTTLSGLTTEPIVLTDPWAMTYRPDHHNFGESFVFEPRLDPNVPQSVLNELAAKNITLIHVYADYQNGSIRYAGPDSPLVDPAESWFGPVTQKYGSVLKSAWFGSVDVTHFPDVQHNKLGWINIRGSGRDSLWCWKYSAPLGWIWTNHAYFPFFYHGESGDWLYCLLPGEPGQASWWYNYTTGEWTVDRPD